MDAYLNSDQELREIKDQYKDFQLSKLPSIPTNPRQPLPSNLSQKQLAQQYFLGNTQQRNYAGKVAESRRKFGFGVGSKGGKSRRRRRRNRK